VLASLGVQRGDRVAVVAPADAGDRGAVFATWKLGALLLSMSVLYGDDGIATGSRTPNPRVLVHRLRRMPAASGEPRCAAALSTSDLRTGPGRSFETLDTAAETPAQLSITSGTTVLAKGIVHAHRYLSAIGVVLPRTCSRRAFPRDGGWQAAGILPRSAPVALGAVHTALSAGGGL